MLDHLSKKQAEYKNTFKSKFTCRMGDAYVLQLDCTLFWALHFKSQQRNNLLEYRSVGLMNLCLHFKPVQLDRFFRVKFYFCIVSEIPALLIACYHLHWPHSHRYMNNINMFTESPALSAPVKDLLKIGIATAKHRCVFLYYSFSFINIIQFFGNTFLI